MEINPCDDAVLMTEYRHAVEVAPRRFDVPTGQSRWVPWMDTVSPYEHDPGASFAELIIPTPDSVRYTYLLETLVLHNKHVLMTGPTGTGKTVPAPRLDASECLHFTDTTRLLCRVWGRSDRVGAVATPSTRSDRDAPRR